MFSLDLSQTSHIKSSTFLANDMYIFPLPISSHTLVSYHTHVAAPRENTDPWARSVQRHSY